MPQDSESKASQRLSKVLDSTDRASKVLGLRNSIYVCGPPELVGQDESRWSTVDDAEDGKPELPPADGGTKAFLFLLSAFIIEGIMWGFPLISSGIFTSFYNQQPHFRNDRYIAVIGTLGTGIPFLGAPVITPLTARWHRYQRQMIWVGWFTCMASLIAASFSTTVWQLIITQGLGYGVGFLVLYYAMLSMLNEWFIERRGLAYGVLFASAGISGTGLPFLTDVCLQKFGYAQTLRGFAVAILVLVGPMLPFMRGRLVPPTSSRTAKIDFKGVLSNPLFYVFSFSNIFQGLAFYLPGLYLYLFANSLGITGYRPVLIICILNLAQVIGQIGLGWLSDKANIFGLITVSSLGSAIIGCVVWYVAKDMTYLLVFAACYGIFAGGYTVLYTRFCSACTSDPATVLWVYGIFAFERGVGNIAAGPLSAELLQAIDHNMGTFDPAQRYRRLILFVGGSLILSALGGVGYLWRSHALGPAKQTYQLPSVHKMTSQLQRKRQADDPRIQNDRDDG